MLRLFRWLSGSVAPSSSVARRPASRPRLALESLDARELPAADWTAVSAAVSAGQSAVVSRAATLTRDALDADLPGVKETVGSAVALGGLLGDAVKVSAGGITTAAQMAARLRSSGFTVIAANDDPDAAGRLLVASKTVSRAVGGTFSAGDVDDFQYWDRTVNGGLNGGPRVSGKATAKVTFGVNLVNGQFQYWLAPDSTVTVTGLKGTGRATGTVRIGALGSVSASADYSIDLSAGVRLRDMDGSGRVELDELRNSRGSTGSVNGSIRIGATFAAKVAGVPLTYQGNFNATVNNSEARASEQLLRPNYETFGKGVAVAFFAGRPKLDVFAPVMSALNTKIPFTGKRLVDFIKTDGVAAALVGINPGITSGIAYDAMLTKLRGVGATFALTREGASAALDKLMRGEKVDLIRQTASISKSWSLGGFRVPIAAVQLGVVGGDVSLYVNPSFGVRGVVTYGLDTGGAYLGSDTAIGASASVAAGFEGTLRVLGFPLAKASGGVELKAELNAKLKDPTPGDGRVYISELKGKPVSSVLGGNLTVDLNGELKAKINLIVTSKTIYSKSFNFGRLVNVNFG